MPISILVNAPKLNVYPKYKINDKNENTNAILIIALLTLTILRNLLLRIRKKSKPIIISLMNTRYIFIE